MVVCLCFGFVLYSSHYSEFLGARAKPSEYDNVSAWSNAYGSIWCFNHINQLYWCHVRICSIGRFPLGLLHHLRQNYATLCATTDFGIFHHLLFYYTMFNDSIGGNNMYI